MTTFSSWLALPENASAQLAVRRIAQDVGSAQPHRDINPLFLHGPSGTGKSHLVLALIAEATQLRPDVTALSLPAADLHRLFRNEEGGGRSTALNEARDVDLLAVEDLQHLAGEAVKPLCGLIDYRHARRRLMVFTAVDGPAALTELPTRLTSRFAQGLVVGLAPLSPKSRRAYLMHRAECRRLPVSEEILNRVAEQVGGSARELEGALSRLETLAEIDPAPLSPDAVTAAFQVDAEARRPTVERITHRVSRYFELSSKQLRARDRSYHVTLPRQVSMYLTRELTQLSLKQIGAYFDGRDHTTVLHACRKVEQALQRDLSLSGVVKQLQADLT